MNCFQRTIAVFTPIHRGCFLLVGRSKKQIKNEGVWGKTGLESNDLSRTQVSGR